MRAESLLEVIHAAFNGKFIEVHSNGQWFRWTGPMIALVEEMQKGTVFRVKREPAECWVLKDDNGRPGACTYPTREEAETLNIGCAQHRIAVLMREVLP